MLFSCGEMGAPEKAGVGMLSVECSNSDCDATIFFQNSSNVHL